MRQSCPASDCVALLLLPYNCDVRCISSVEKHTSRESSTAHHPCCGQQSATAGVVASTPKQCGNCHFLSKSMAIVCHSPSVDGVFKKSSFITWYRAEHPKLFVRWCWSPILDLNLMNLNVSPVA